MGQHLYPFVDGQGKEKIFNSPAVNIDYTPKMLKVVNHKPSIGGHKSNGQRREKGSTSLHSTRKLSIGKQKNNHRLLT